MTLGFSSLSFSRKVSHTTDLSRPAALFLLFRKDIPTPLLLSESRLLLARNIPIRVTSSVFYHVNDYSVLEDTCSPVEAGNPTTPLPVSSLT